MSLIRDDSMTKSFCFKDNELWTEFKCMGKSIKRRGYHSSVIYKDEYRLGYLDCMCMVDTTSTLASCLTFIKLMLSKITASGFN